MVGITNNSIAQQMYGRWVVPTQYGPGSPSETYEIVFYDNAIVLNPLLMTSISNPIEFSAGGYNDNYNIDFYTLGDKIYHNTSTYVWPNSSVPNLETEYQIIKKPGASSNYYTFFTHLIDGVDQHFMYNEISFNNSQIDISTETTIRGGLSGSVAFAITPEDTYPRYIYAATSRVAFEIPWHYAGLRKWEITDNGLVYIDRIIDENNTGFDEYDFDAYNLELKIDDYQNTIIAYIHANENNNPSLTPTELIVVINNNPIKYNLNIGRLAGIEFSQFEENMIYVSSENSGIVKVNYTTGNVIQSITTSDFNRTFLQTAPDGHIYAVSNNGNQLGRIYQYDVAADNKVAGDFISDAITFPTNEQVSTLNKLDGTNSYYILPENSRVYSALTNEVLLTDVTCSGYTNGEAKIYVSGGTPFNPPNEPYNITCTNNANFIWDDDGYFIATNLGENTYDYTITDNAQPNPNVLQGQFTINVDYSNFTHPEDDIEITLEPDGTNPEWLNINESYAHGFTVLSGVELTINSSTIQFGADAHIIIEQGAKVILNNSTLTNYALCNSKWQGIEVWGTKTQHQYSYPGNPCAQGTLKIENGSIIENAVSAVELWNPENYSTTGGIVQARDSYFYNNAKSVHALYYSNYNPTYPSQLADNISYFINCTFDVDTNYIVDEYIFHKHVDLASVKGFNFEGCDFSLSASGNNISLWNMGIAAYDAGFSVLPKCTSTSNPCNSNDSCSFSGFYRGISSTSDEAIYTFTVDMANFTNNSTGVYISTINYPVVINSNFKIGNTSGDSTSCLFTNNYGIDAHNSVGFVFEDNYFEKFIVDTSVLFTGIRVYECPSESDDIYRNEFVGLSFGNYAEKFNRSTTYEDFYGVSYLCNENYNNKYDFYIADSSTIRGNMGTKDIPSGNVLTDTAICVVQIQNNFTQNIEYYFNLNEQNEQILKYSDHVSPYPVDSTNTCPPHYGEGGGDIKLTSGEIMQKEQEYYQNLNNYNGIVTLYNNLSDGGNTTSELLDIQTALPDDMWALRMQLLGDSPHLSREVLMETADKTDVFPETAIFDIMAANPDELRKDTLINYLENKSEPLPEYMIETLRQLANGSTYKTVLRNQMSTYNSGKVKAAQDIIHSILWDSITDQSLLRNWHDNIGGYVTDKQIVNSYIFEGDTSNALALLNMLPSLYDLQGKYLDAYNDYKEIVNLKITLQKQNRSILQLDSLEIIGLESIALTSSGDARDRARNILEYAYGYHFCDCTNLPDTTGFKSKSFNSIVTLTKPDELRIIAKPNPASTWVSFDYTIGLTDEKATITISDIQGKVIETIYITGNHGQITWDIRDKKPGVYIYTLKSSTSTRSGKLIIK